MVISLIVKHGDNLFFTFVVVVNGNMYNGTDSKYNPPLPTQTNENPNYDIIVKLSHQINQIASAK